MKSLHFILIASSLAASAIAQQGAMPPRPGSPTAAIIAAQAAEVPTLPEPEELSDTTAPEGPDQSVTTISGSALPAEGSALVETQSPPDATVASAETTESSIEGDPSTGSNPPGTPGQGVPKEPAKVDFLQRSNLILAKLLDSERVVDPFGLVMDPANAKEAPLLADQYEEEKEATVVNNSMLKNALLTIPITGVYPQQEKIVIGARSFNIGGQFGMKLQDLTIRLRFEGIRGGEIFFKDMETREVTSLPYNTRPAEFEPMVKGSKRAPGEGIVPMNDLFIAN